MNMATIRVKVEQRHIDSAERHNGDRCPIALAAREQVHPKAFMSIARGLRFGPVRRLTDWYWSNSAVIFAKRFDAGQPVTPHTFIFKQDGSR